MALSTTMVFEVANGGSDNYGGGYNGAGSSPGTDYSTSTTPHVVIDGVTITALVHTTTTQLTLVGYTVATTDNRNTVQITGGTATAGTYEITTVDTVNNRWTLDRSAGTAAQTTVGNMGGCLASPGKALAIAVNQSGLNHNKIWLKYNASVFSITSTTANANGGRLSFANSGVELRGYDQTRGDHTANRPTISASVGSMTMVTFNSSSCVLDNVILDANSQTSVTGIDSNSQSYVKIDRVKVLGATGAYGFRSFTGAKFLRCVSKNASGAVGFQGSGGSLKACTAMGGNSVGFQCSTAGSTRSTSLVDCLSINNTNSSSDGFLVSNSGDGAYLDRCVAYNNGGSGFNIGDQEVSTLVNCIAEGHTGGSKFGFTRAGGLLNCAAYNNTTNFDTNLSQEGSVTLTASPFTNAAGNDFSLNTTSGGGANCRAAGFPGSFPSDVSTTGYADIGCAQHADPAASGGGSNVTVVGGAHTYIE